MKLFKFINATYKGRLWPTINSMQGANVLWSVWLKFGDCIIDPITSIKGCTSLMEDDCGGGTLPPSPWQQ